MAAGAVGRSTAMAMEALKVASLVLLAVTPAAMQPAQLAPCSPDELAVYRVHLDTHWSRERFPKQYPEWRPPAGWSKLVGRTHDSSYWLFREGEQASAGLQAFAEKGHSDALEAADQAGVYDEFTAPPVVKGVGRTLADCFLDGNHSLVSVAVRVVPSPDWFIGIDSLDLCRSGHWIESIAIQVDPMDAGTDNGFTFTAPNWPSDPKEPVSRITSKRPSHPANSFFYPSLDELPPIATFTFVKCPASSCPACPCALDAPQLSSPSDELADDDDRDITTTDYSVNDITDVGNDYWSTNINDYSTDSSTPDGVTDMTGSSSPPPPPECSCSCAPPPSADTNTTSGTPRIRTLCTAAAGVTGVPQPNRTPTFMQSEMDDIDELLEERVYHLSSEFVRNVTVPRDPQDVVEISNEVGQPLDSFRTNKTRRSKSKGSRPAKHCQLSEWSEWSPCSVSCGVGEAARSRRVLAHPRRGGKPCAPLHEKRWCGGHSKCPQNFFNW